MSSSTLHWQAAYDTGVEEIDLQHRYFMTLINRLTVELAASDDPKYRQSLLNELAKYAAFHFASEENLMTKFGYPDRERHRMLHIELIDKLSSRMNAMTYEPLFEFLIGWFIQHTTTEDHRIGEHVRVAHDQQSPFLPQPAL